MQTVTPQASLLNSDSSYAVVMPLFHPLHTAHRSVSASLGFARLNQTAGWVRGAPCCFCNLSLYLYSLKYLECGQQELYKRVFQLCVHWCFVHQH